MPPAPPRRVRRGTWMNVIHRLVARRLVVLAAVILSFAVVIVASTQVLSQVFSIIDASGGVWAALVLLVLMLPKTVAAVLPLAWLVALVQTYESMRESRESVIVSAAGRAPLYLFRPAFLLSVLVALAMLASALFLEPRANRAMRQALYDLRYESLSIVARDSVLREVEDGLYVRGGPQDPDGTINGFFILDRRDRPAERLYVAETVRLTRKDGVPQLEMSNGRIHVRGADGQEAYSVAFRRCFTDPEDFFSDLPGRFGATETSTAALVERVRAGRDGPRTRGELVRRASEWLTPLAFAALAGWLVVRGQTRGAAARGDLRGTMVIALGLGGVLRVASYVALGAAGDSAVAAVASFAVPLGAAALFGWLALAASRGPRRDGAGAVA